MGKYLYYTWLNLPYAAIDMFQLLLLILSCVALLHITIKSQKSQKHIALIWTGIVIPGYAAIVLACALQYAAYYDLYTEQIMNNMFLYILVWLVDALLQLFSVFLCCLGAVKIFDGNKEKSVFCTVLFFLFLEFVTYFLVDVVYLCIFHKKTQEGSYEQNMVWYLLITAVCLGLFVMIYRLKIKDKLLTVLNTPDLPLKKYTFSPIISIFLFNILIKITKSAGVDIFQEKMTFISVIIFSSIVLIFILLYKDLLLSMRVSGQLAKTEAEIGVAEAIQKNVLPNIFPAFPDRDEFDIYATMTPCLGVGGDFYDFFLTDDDHLAVVMADVSGKGVPAALFMMCARTLINTYSRTGISPSKIMEQVNNRLCDGNDTNMFVTVFLGILNLKTNQFCFTNAGHNFPLVAYDGKNYEYLKTKVNFVMGAMEDTSYSEFEVTLPKGSVIFLYTDGVTEAMNEEEKLYGEERLQSFLNGLEKNISPQKITEQVFDNLKTYVGNAAQADDITMLALKMSDTEDN
jgi:sigma-B regulation protein RsbU (phosphoserine phosphatase)